LFFPDRILTFYPSRIPDPGVKKARDPVSRIPVRYRYTSFLFRVKEEPAAPPPPFMEAAVAAGLQQIPLHLKPEYYLR
jgi:hypothetical protein